MSLLNKTDWGTMDKLINAVDEQGEARYNSFVVAFKYLDVDGRTERKDQAVVKPDDLKARMWTFDNDKNVLVVVVASRNGSVLHKITKEKAAEVRPIGDSPDVRNFNQHDDAWKEEAVKLLEMEIEHYHRKDS